MPEQTNVIINGQEIAAITPETSSDYPQTWLCASQIAKKIIRPHFGGSSHTAKAAIRHAKVKNSRKMAFYIRAYNGSVYSFLMHAVTVGAAKKMLKSYGIPFKMNGIPAERPRRDAQVEAVGATQILEHHDAGAAMVVLSNDGRPVTTSLKVAEAFGKEHNDVLKKIRALDCSESFVLGNFYQNTRTDRFNRNHPYYEMTRDGFMFLVMGFTGKKAAKVKEAFIFAFNEMERRLTNPAPALPAPDSAGVEMVGVVKELVSTVGALLAEIRESRKPEPVELEAVEARTDYRAWGEEITQIIQNHAKAVGKSGAEVASIFSDSFKRLWERLGYLKKCNIKKNAEVAGLSVWEYIERMGWKNCAIRVAYELFVEGGK